MKYKLKYIPTTACVMLKRNPQFLKPAVLDALRASIRLDGFVAPILVRPINGGGDRYEILSGNHRWMAARDVGLEEISAVIADLNPAQAARLAVNLNTVHGDPPIDTLAPFLAEMDDETLMTIHIDPAMKKQLVLFDSSLQARLVEMQIPESVDRPSKPSTIPTCSCPTCGKRHSPPRVKSNSM
jgi:ParB-like chromosome segregation protein Spo0J